MIGDIWPQPIEPYIGLQIKILLGLKKPQQGLCLRNRRPGQLFTSYIFSFVHKALHRPTIIARLHAGISLTQAFLLALHRHFYQPYIGIFISLTQAFLLALHQAFSLTQAYNNSQTICWHQPTSGIGISLTYKLIKPYIGLQ